MILRKGVVYKYGNEYVVTLDGVTAQWREVPPNASSKTKVLKRFKKGDLTFLTKYGMSERIGYYTVRKLKSVTYTKSEERYLL